MSLQSLSNEWFDQVMVLRAGAAASLGEAEVRSAKQNISVSVSVSVPRAAGEKPFAVSGGEPGLGHVAKVVGFT